MNKIKTALVSVSDKSGIVEFANMLAEFGVKIISTGGTYKALNDAGIPVVDISEITGFPEIMDGRVKTLHPKVHGGLLGVRDNKDHLQAMQLHGIGEIDMVVVNLYPFAAAVARGAEYEEIIENIDIGGPSMIRSGAKNHKYVTVITDPADYKIIESEMRNNSGHIAPHHNFFLAAKAFSNTARYDSAISNWFTGLESNPKFPDQLNINAVLKQSLRYGENPHQQAAFYVLDSSVPGVAGAQQLQGKELSYNNINDTDAAFQIVAEFAEPCVAIVKHANPCGVAAAAGLTEAYTKALAADPVSAFGGIIACNREIDPETAEEIAKLFAEVVIAPGISVKAQEILAAKKNLRVLVTEKMPQGLGGLSLKSVRGGLLVQDLDNASVEIAELKQVSSRAPTEAELADLLFAFKVVKHVKSNAIVTARNTTTTGIGAGQMNRVGSVEIAVKNLTPLPPGGEGGGPSHAPSAQARPSPNPLPEGEGQLSHQVLASDAFFPFADGVEAAARAGITAIIHPGGSMRDAEVFAAADKHNIAMVVTGKRSFKH